MKNFKKAFKSVNFRDAGRKVWFGTKEALIMYILVYAAWTAPLVYLNEKFSIMAYIEMFTGRGNGFIGT